MSTEPTYEKRNVAHFEIEENAGLQDGSLLEATTTGGTGTEKGYAGSFIGDTHRAETRKAERKLLLKLGKRSQHRRQSLRNR